MRMRKMAFMAFIVVGPQALFWYWKLNPGYWAIIHWLTKNRFININNYPFRKAVISEIIDRSLFSWPVFMLELFAVGFYASNFDWRKGLDHALERIVMVVKAAVGVYSIFKITNGQGN